MAAGKPVSATQIDKALTLVAAGFTLSKIADEIDCHVTTLNRILLAEYAEDYEAAKERRRDLIRSERWTRAFDRADKWSAKFLDEIALEQLPETRDARRAVNVADPQEERSDQIAEALERLAAATVSLAQSKRAELPPGAA